MTGVCTGCVGNTGGDHCESCLPNFVKSPNGLGCIGNTPCFFLMSDKTFNKASSLCSAAASSTPTSANAMVGGLLPYQLGVIIGVILLVALIVLIAVVIYIRKSKRRTKSMLLEGAAVNLHDFQAFAGSSDNTAYTLKSNQSGNTTFMNTTYGRKTPQTQVFLCLLADFFCLLFFLLSFAFFLFCRCDFTPWVLEVELRGRHPN